MLFDAVGVAATEDVVWVATHDGITGLDKSGTIVMEIPSPPGVVTALAASDALEATTDRGTFEFRHGEWSAVPSVGVETVRFAGHLAVRYGNGTVVMDGVALTGDAVDIAVAGGALRVAAVDHALVWDGAARRLEVPAVVAGRLWGTAEGALLDDQGRRVAAVPGLPRWVGTSGSDEVIWTSEGVFVLGAGLVQLAGRSACDGGVVALASWGGRLVKGTFDDGVCTEEGGSWKRIPGVPSPLVNDVIATGDALWIAHAEGVTRVDAAGAQSFGAAPKPGEPGLGHRHGNALSAAVDAVWVADTVGPTRIGRDGTWKQYRRSVTGHSYQTIAACATGEVWVGSEDDGLAVRGVRFGAQNGRTGWRHVSAIDGLPEDWVMAVACAGPGAAWVGTYRHGVGRVDASGWHPIAGLEDAWVESLAVQGDILWVGTLGGLYSVRDGVAVRVNEVETNALLVTDRGVWAGGERGVTRIR